MTNETIRRFIIFWVEHLDPPTLMEGYADLIDLHEGLLSDVPYWPQMHRIIQDVATEL